jgi:predicted nucleotidyltransferase
MQSVSNEPWARHSHRLKTYIKTQIDKKSPKQKSAKNNTTSRLGFANTGYSQLDTAGTNEIARSLISTVNIEFKG